MLYSWRKHLLYHKISEKADAFHAAYLMNRKIFAVLAIFAHRYASLLANHYMEYEEKHTSEFLAKACYGAVAAAMEEE